MNGRFDVNTQDTAEQEWCHMTDWRDWCKVLVLLHSVLDLQEAVGLLVQTHQISLRLTAMYSWEMNERE